MSLRNNVGDIKIQVPGKGAWVLTQNDHVATGGEGSVYVCKGYAFKILLDQANAASSAFQGRIALLKGLKSDKIISPLDFVYDDKGNTLGYYMEAFKGEPLVRSFPTPWRKRNSFDNPDALLLCKDMWEANEAAHDAGAVIVDGNDTNYLFQPKARLALIDVDSWQIGGFKATAIKDSVRDFSVKEFNSDTDWFSWGVVSFQVFTGTHPYQGTHPGFKPGQMVDRMKANASVFDPQVSLSKAVRDFTCIPLDLRNWYEEVFQNGYRGQPPKPGAQTVAKHAPRRVKVCSNPVTGHLKHTLVKILAGEEILSILECGVVITRTALDEHFAYHIAANSKVVRVLIPGRLLRKILAGKGVLIENNGLWAITLSDSGVNALRVYRDGEPRESAASVPAKYPMELQDLFTVGGAVFGTCEGQAQGLLELGQSTTGSIYTRRSWPVAVNSTRVFNNILVSDILGTPFLVELHEGFCSTRCVDLKGYDVIDAVSFKGPTNHVGRRGLILGTDKATGQNYRLTLEWGNLEAKVVERVPVDYPSFNITVTNMGIGVDVSEDGKLRVYDRLGVLKAEVDSDVLDSGMPLYSAENRVYYSFNDQVYQLTFN